MEVPDRYRFEIRLSARSAGVEVAGVPVLLGERDGDETTLVFHYGSLTASASTAPAESPSVLQFVNAQSSDIAVMLDMLRAAVPHVEASDVGVVRGTPVMLYRATVPLATLAADVPGTELPDEDATVEVELAVGDDLRVRRGAFSFGPDEHTRIDLAVEIF